MIMGGTYETPITEGLLDEDFVDQLKLMQLKNFVIAIFIDW